jgi:hypothetical protein
MYLFNEEEAKEANDLANLAGEATPRSSNKRLRSLFKIRADAQVADKVELRARTSTGQRYLY